MERFVEMEDYLQDYRIQRTMLKREKLDKECNCFTDSLKEQIEILIEEHVFWCNAALYSRRKKHFIFDSINTITAPSFR